MIHDTLTRRAFLAATTTTALLAATARPNDARVVPASYRPTSSSTSPPSASVARA